MVLTAIKAVLANYHTPRVQNMHVAEVVRTVGGTVSVKNVSELVSAGISDKRANAQYV